MGMFFFSSHFLWSLTDFDLDVLGNRLSLVRNLTLPPIDYPRTRLHIQHRPASYRPHLHHSSMYHYRGGILLR